MLVCKSPSTLKLWGIYAWSRSLYHWFQCYLACYCHQLTCWWDNWRWRYRVIDGITPKGYRCLKALGSWYVCVNELYLQQCYYVSFTRSVIQLICFVWMNEIDCYNPIYCYIPCRNIIMLDFFLTSSWHRSLQLMVGRALWIELSAGSSS